MFQFQCEFADADEWHPATNVDKMSRGIPLTDQVSSNREREIINFNFPNCQDRSPWLLSLHDLLASWCKDTSLQAVNGVLACSALKRSYRDTLSGRKRLKEKASGDTNIKRCVFVLLGVSESELVRRVGSRKDHFMPTSLIRSQLETLEVPNGEEELTVTVETDNLGIDEIVMKIIDKLKHMKIIN